MSVSSRDIFIAFVCVIGILLILNEEGTITFEKAFESERLSIVPEKLPPPMIMHKYKGKESIYMVQVEVMRSGVALSIHDIGYMKHKPQNINYVFNVKKFDSIFLTEYVSHWNLYQPLVTTMDIGTIEYGSDEEYIGVFLSDWKVSLYNSNGEQLWVRNVLDALRESMNSMLEEYPLFEFHFGRPTKTTIKVMPYRVYKVDKGMVVLGFETSVDLVLKKGRLSQFNHKLDYNLDHRKTEYVYFAFDARTGELRWQHGQSDFMNGLYRVNGNNRIEKLDRRFPIEHEHSGEIPWVAFIENVMLHFPHMWNENRDTIMVTDHFNKELKHTEHVHLEKERYGLKKLKLNKLFPKKRNVRKNLKYHKVNEPSNENVDDLPNVLVTHRDSSIEVLNLYTGGVICQLSPLLRNRAYSPASIDNPILYSFSSRHMSDALVENKDIMNGKSDSSQQRTENSNCMAIVEAGAPDTLEQVFSADVCTNKKGISKFSLSQLKMEKLEYTQGIAISSPVSLMYYNGNKNNLNFDTVYFASNGLFTSIGSDNGEWKVRWQKLTKLAYDPLNSQPDDVQIFPFMLKQDEFDSYVVAIVKGTINVLDVNGKLHLELETEKSVDRVQIIDINGDGINDIVLSTYSNYEGYITRVHSGRSMLTYFIIAFVLILGILNLSTMIELSDPYFKKAEEFKK